MGDPKDGGLRGPQTWEECHKVVLEYEQREAAHRAVSHSVYSASGSQSGRTGSGSERDEEPQGCRKGWGEGSSRRGQSRRGPADVCRYVEASWQGRRQEDLLPLSDHGSGRHWCMSSCVNRGSVRARQAAFLAHSCRDSCLLERKHLLILHKTEPHPWRRICRL